MRIRRFVKLGWMLVAIAMLTATTVAIAKAVPAAATEPTTVPATVLPDATVTGATKLLTDKFNHLTVDQIFDPGFWRSFLLDAIRWTIGFIPRLIVAAFLIFFFWVIYRVVRKVLLGMMKTAGVDESIRDMLSHLLKWVVLGFGLIIAGNQIGLEIAALLTGVSIIGLAVGFAAQESLSNFIAGIMIFLDKPFKVGDWIDFNGQVGQVKRVTFRSTRMTNQDGDIVVLPNVQVLSTQMINKSANAITRVRVNVGIAYDASIEEAREAILSLTRGDSRVERMPAPKVDVIHLNNSSVDLEFRFWIRDEQYENAMRNEYTEKVKLALDAARIAIPFPHLQLVTESGTAKSLVA
jgi:small conductance mechanosensitive channel